MENPNQNCFRFITKAEQNLRDQMRMLWEQHVYWTRLTIVGIAFDSPNLAETIKRLLRNADDFGVAFFPFYGEGAARKFSNLIRSHLVIAAELVLAAKAGDSQKAADAEGRWEQNADQIVYFLNWLNPYWSIESQKKMWHEHLDLTKNEAVAILTGKYAESVALFDQIEQLALMMADSFTAGIIHQFPEEFK